MKTLWAALIGLTATAWTFEGDWSTWDGTREAKEAQAEESPAYRTSGTHAGEASFYEFRAMGRSESRWMGSQEGHSPSLADLNGTSRFDWTRFLGRAEAHHIDGSSRTAPYVASGRAPSGERWESVEFGCNLVEANRSEGRDEARDMGAGDDLGAMGNKGGQAGGTGEPPTTWEMDEKAEQEAASSAAGKTGC